MFFKRIRKVFENAAIKMYHFVRRNNVRYDVNDIEESVGVAQARFVGTSSSRIFGIFDCWARVPDKSTRLTADRDD